MRRLGRGIPELPEERAGEGAALSGVSVRNVGEDKEGGNREKLIVVAEHVEF